MSKPPQVRINAVDLDRLMKLTWPQERVWMYYKRREGDSGKAWGKAQTIADWANIEPGTVRNARSWLVRNGWLKPNGKSKSGLPMFLAVIPQLHPEGDQVSLHNDTTVTAQLHRVSLPSETEVPTLKYLPEKYSAVTSGVSERESEHTSPPAAAAVVPPSTPQWNSGLFTDRGHTILTGIYLEEVPLRLYPRCEEIASALNSIAERYPYTHDQWVAFFTWQKTHKGGALRYRDFDQFMAGHETSMNDYADHTEATCRVCRSQRKMRIEMPAYRLESGQRDILGKGDI